MKDGKRVELPRVASCSGLAKELELASSGGSGGAACLLRVSTAKYVDKMVSEKDIVQAVFLLSLHSDSVGRLIQVLSQFNSSIFIDFHVKNNSA